MYTAQITIKYLSDKKNERPNDDQCGLEPVIEETKNPARIVTKNKICRTGLRPEDKY